MRFANVLQVIIDRLSAAFICSIVETLTLGLNCVFCINLSLRSLEKFESLSHLLLYRLLSNLRVQSL